MVAKQEIKNDFNLIPETPKEFAIRWVGYLREEIQRIEKAGRDDKGVDVERAVRGIIIGEIFGDVSNPILGAILIVNRSKKKQRILN